MRIPLALLLSFTAQAATTKTATLAWNASPTTNVTYNLYWSTDNARWTYVTNTASLTATDIYSDADTNYWMVKASKAGVESTPSNTVKIDPVGTAPQPPAPPTNLRVTAISGNRYDLSWQGQLAYSTAIERAPPNGAFSVLAMIAPGTLHYSTTVKPHEEWYFQARSCGNPCSGPSNQVIVRR
jgi:hypothetical protein